MASNTPVSSASVNQTLAQTKKDFGLVAEWLAKGGHAQLGVNPATINVLKAVVASTDTTDLRTTTA